MFNPHEFMSDVMDVMTDKLPAQIREIMNTLYTEDAGARIGKAVGALYKELVGCGVPHDEAVQMAEITWRR